MTFDPGGHHFDFVRGVCMRCGMSLEKFKDNGRPRCTGQPSDKKERLSIPPDDDSPDAA